MNKKIWSTPEAATICEALSRKGFSIGKRKIWIEVTFNREKMAQAFEGDGDLSEALEPMMAALRQAMLAKPELDQLAQLIRKG